jgi:hypothetical protein
MPPDLTSYESAEEVFVDLAQTVTEFEGLSYERIGDQGAKLAESAPSRPERLVSAANLRSQKDSREGMWRAATAVAERRWPRSDGGRGATVVAERHWGAASRCDPATHLTGIPRPFEPPPPWPVATPILHLSPFPRGRRVLRQALTSCNTLLWAPCHGDRTLAFGQSYRGLWPLFLLVEGGVSSVNSTTLLTRNDHQHRN